MKKLSIPHFDTLEEKIDFLIENKNTLQAQKMSSIKHADSFSAIDLVFNEGEEVSKEDIDSAGLLEKDNIIVKAVINTTNILDSHGDVHLKGLWKKSIKENKRIMHIQEHDSRKFSSIISDGKDLKAYVEEVTWKSLGYNVKGNTEALIFLSDIKKSRNGYMFDQYAKGYVNNHSVGMRYVKMELAVNDEKHEKEYENWEKYIDQVVNRKDAEKAGHFWAVLEAKAIEGSAVPLGSNAITPTLSIKNEPSEDTQLKEAAENALQEKREYFINLSNHQK